MADVRPIGIFDSGIGGLTVAHAISQSLPKEQIIYFGDNAHLPYGDKSSAAIRRFSDKICQFLMKQNCKLIIIACNSASSASYPFLHKKYSDQILIANVVDPVVQFISQKKYDKAIGVIGTRATIRSRIYPRKIRKANENIQVRSLATPLLADMIEEGFYNNNISRAIIRSYLEKPGIRDIEALILACTHYPLIREDIAAYYKEKIEIFDTMGIVADFVKSALSERKMLSNKKRRKSHQFFVSDYTKSFEETARIFWGSKINLEEIRNVSE